MLTNTFFVCQNCGNVTKFKIFTSNFRVVKQSPETGIRIEESNIMPSLREIDNYIECQMCFKKLKYDSDSLKLILKYKIGRMKS